MPPLDDLAAPRLRLFGRPMLTPAAGTAGPPVPLPAQAPILLLLALGVAGDWCERERLVALFWPAAGEADALRSLRVTLHRSRQWLQPLGLADVLQSRGGTLRLAVASDVALFRTALGAGDAACALAAQDQPLLPGFVARAFPVLEEWIGLEREVLRRAWRDLAGREAERLAMAGELGEAITLLLSRVDDEPLAEEPLQALLRWTGHTPPGHPARAAAMQRFEGLARHLRRELSATPSEATRALAEGLRHGVPRAAAGAARPAGATPAPPTLLADAPWVGRDEELAALRVASSELIVVSGEPGIGKSRLVAELAPEQGEHTMWWRCRQGLQSVPLLCVAESLQRQVPRLLSLLAQDGGTRRELARLVPALAGDETLAPAEGPSAALLLALVRVLPRLAERLVIDDLQWADSSTLQLLRLLASEASLRLLATLRSAEAGDETTRWLAAEQAAGRARSFVLGRWAEAATATLVTRLSGRPAPHFAAWLQQRCGGNPLFVLETLRALFERRMLNLGTNGWISDLDELSPDCHELHVPDRVAALLHERLARLSEAALRLVRAAALLGAARPLSALARVVELSDWAAAQALAEAEAAGLMHGDEFVHDLAREAVLGQVPAALARLLHTGLVRELAALLPPHRLAEHAWAAGDEREAVASTLRASRADRLLGLCDTARATLMRARERTRDPERLAALETELAECAEMLDEAERAEHHAQAALALPAAPADRAAALGTLVTLHMRRGELDAAVALAAMIVAEHPDWPDRYTVPAKLAHAVGDFERAAELMQQHVQWLRTQEQEQLAPAAELASALSGLAVALAALGRTAEATPLHHEAMRIAQRSRARFVEVYATANWLHGFDGNIDEAIARGEAALALGEYKDSNRLRLQLVARCIDGERWHDALGHLGPVCESASPVYHAYAWARRITVHAALGEQEARRAAIEQAFVAAGRIEDPRAQAMVAASVLHDGDEADVPRAAALLRPWRLDPALQRRLAAGLSKRGIEVPAVSAPG